MDSADADRARRVPSASGSRGTRQLGKSQSRNRSPSGYPRAPRGERAIDIAAWRTNRHMNAPIPALELALASARALRMCLGFTDGPLPHPLPRCVTRYHASLDNFCADLLLRACHAQRPDLAPLEEYRLRETNGALRVRDNPALRGAVLIGIGGVHGQTEALAVYDEHAQGGKRRVGSTTKLVFDLHVASTASPEGLAAVGPVIGEIDDTDSKGGASGDHLYSLLKTVHLARYIENEGSAARLSMEWKRAIIGAALSAVLVEPQRDTFDNADAVMYLQREWNDFRTRTDAARAAGALPSITPAGGERIAESLSRTEQAIIHGRLSALTLRRVAVALRRAWPPEVSCFLLGFFLEAMLQGQSAFELVMSRPLRLTPSRSGYVVLFHRQSADEILPHRALGVRMRAEGLRGIIVVLNPAIDSTMVTRGNQVTVDQWKRFVALLRAGDAPGTWYVPTAADGTIADFALNRTESFVGAPTTRLRPAGFAELLGKAVGR
jgi:hypothetical protein